MIFLFESMNCIWRVEHLLDLKVVSYSCTPVGRRYPYRDRTLKRKSFCPALLTLTSPSSKTHEVFWKTSASWASVPVRDSFVSLILVIGLEHLRKVMLTVKKVPTVLLHFCLFVIFSCFLGDQLPHGYLHSNLAFLHIWIYFIKNISGEKWLNIGNFI